MLNPSTADAQLDDPTIRRCRGFAASWGYAGIEVVNLYALRSPAPAALWKHADPHGPENDHHLYAAARQHGAVLCAWGRHARPDRVATAVALFRAAGVADRDITCLGLTKDGAPRHPLYVHGGTLARPWSGAAGIELASQPVR